METKNWSAAAAHLQRARVLDPLNADYHYHAGVAAFQLNGLDEARQCCHDALAADPLATPPRFLLMEMDLPGPSYFQVLSMLHSHLRPRTYVEIGVANGASITLAHPETRAIGIDPQPVISHSLTARTSIHALTSDDYFAKHDVRAEFDGLPVDLGFIDGMHLFEFALRDFINIEKHCAPQSTILIHDCYPFDRLTAERERRTQCWSGDIWRLILILRKYRPDLRVHTIAAAPTGLGLVRGLNPQSRVLDEKFDEIVSEYLALDYSALDADKPGMLALYPNDWEKIKTLLN